MQPGKAFVFESEGEWNRFTMEVKRCPSVERFNANYKDTIFKRHGDGRRGQGGTSIVRLLILFAFIVFIHDIFSFTFKINVHPSLKLKLE